MTDDEYDAWVESERPAVKQYLERQGISSPNIEWPAFDVPPHFAIWAVESKGAPGNVGWWAFSGDCPTDYVSEDGNSHPRNALKLLLDRWGAYVPELKGGKQPSGIHFGNGTPPKILGDLLQDRVALLTSWLEDEELWKGL